MLSLSYQRDGASVVAPVLSDAAARYLPGISERRGGASTFFHDSLKNAGVQTNSSAAVSATRHYDAWGNVVSSTGTWQSPFGYAGRFGYQGDPTGFKLLGHRYYDPTVGRFLTRDPIKDGRNWYAYCANSPLVHVDPDGRLFKVLVIALAVIIGGGLLGASCTIMEGEDIREEDGDSRTDHLNDWAAQTDSDYDGPDPHPSMGGERFQQTIQNLEDTVAEEAHDSMVGGPVKETAKLLKNDWVDRVIQGYELYKAWKEAQERLRK